MGYLLGTIENSSIGKFQKLLFRLSRGTAFTNFEQINTKVLKSDTNLTYFEGRSAVLIVFQSGNDRIFGNKILNACKAYEMKFYDYMNPQKEESKMKMKSVSDHIDEIRKVIRG